MQIRSERDTLLSFHGTWAMAGRSAACQCHAPGRVAHTHIYWRRTLLQAPARHVRSVLGAMARLGLAGVRALRTPGRKGVDHTPRGRAGAPRAERPPSVHHVAGHMPPTSPVRPGETHAPTTARPRLLARRLTRARPRPTSHVPAAARPRVQPSPASARPSARGLPRRPNGLPPSEIACSAHRPVQRPHRTPRAGALFARGAHAHMFSLASAKMSCLKGSWLRKEVSFLRRWRESEELETLATVRFSKRKCTWWKSYTLTFHQAHAGPR